MNLVEKHWEIWESELYNDIMCDITEEVCQYVREKVKELNDDGWNLGDFWSDFEVVDRFKVDNRLYLTWDLKNGENEVIGKAFISIFKDFDNEAVMTKNKANVLVRTLQA